MRKLAALIAVLALALAAPPASLAGPAAKEKKPCHTVGKGHAYAKATPSRTSSIAAMAKKAVAARPWSSRRPRAAATALASTERLGGGNLAEGRLDG